MGTGCFEQLFEKRFEKVTKLMIFKLLINSIRSTDVVRKEKSLLASSKFLKFGEFFFENLKTRMPMCFPLENPEWSHLVCNSKFGSQFEILKHRSSNLFLIYINCSGRCIGLECAKSELNQFGSVFLLTNSRN